VGLRRVTGLTGGTVVMGLCFQFCFSKWVSSMGIFQIVFLFMGCVVFCHIPFVLSRLLPASVMYGYCTVVLTRGVGSRRVTGLNRLMRSLLCRDLLWGWFVFWGILLWVVCFVGIFVSAFCRSC